MAKLTPTPQHRAWLAARAVHYANTRSLTALATMVVELEDEHDCSPEFDIDEDWPESVAHMDLRVERKGRRYGR